MKLAESTPTRYEVKLVRGTEVLHSYGFTARKSKAGLLAMMTDNVEHLFTEDEAVAAADEFQPTYSRKLGLTRSPWRSSLLWRY